MEYSKALTFIWEDPRWQQKMLIGVGVVIASVVLSFVLIGILGYLIVAGYSIRLMENVRTGVPHPLPEWDEWGEDLARGFKLAVVAVAWALPIIVLTIPSGLGSAMAGSSSEGIQAFGFLIAIATACLSFLYGLFVAVATPGFSIAFAQDEQITSGLQFRSIIEWTRENIGQIVVVVLVYLVASFALSLLAAISGILLCIVGLIVTIPAATLIMSLFQYHLYGQLASAYPFGGGTSGASGVGTSTSGASETMMPLAPMTSSTTPPADMTPGVEPGMEPPTPGGAGAVSDAPSESDDSSDQGDTGEPKA